MAQNEFAQIGRRGFLAAAAGAALLRAQAADGKRPRLGVVVDIHKPELADSALARVREFGLSGCQAHVGEMPSIDLAGAIRDAMKKHQVEITAAMTLGPGKIEWNFYGGPKTCGLVPADLRAQRIKALVLASDLAKACGIGAIHTHCGFIPEDPNSAVYTETVAAIREVAQHAKTNGQIFLMETGQESPVTLLRTITDTGLDNVKVNLDVANLILYGKGEPVGALDVIGPYVRGLHAKDGLYPTNGKQLGKEVPIGQGRVNFPEVIRKLKELNYAGPITIEREISGPQQGADIKASKQFLEKLIAQFYG